MRNRAADIPTPTLVPETEKSAERAKFQREMGHISRQSSVFFAGTIFTAATAYLFKVYLARKLGAEALGIYTLGMTIIGFLGIFNALGLPQSALRFVAAYRATGQLDLLRGLLVRGTLLLLFANLTLGGLVLVVGPWVAVHFYHTPELNPYLLLFALIMLTGAMNTWLGQVLGGYRDVARRTLITNFIGSPLMMLFTIALVTAGYALRGYIWAQVASAVIVTVLLAVAVWRLTPREARGFSAPPARLERQVISFSAAAFGISFLEFLMAQADKVMVGFYLNAREVGIYAVAAALVTFVPIVLQSVNQIFASTIADLHARHDHQLLGRLFQTLTKWILGMTLPLAISIMIFAAPLMRIFGPDFEAGWPILVIGTAGQLVNCAVGSVGYMLMMSGNQHRLIRVQAFAAGLMVVLNIVLIPKWGLAGAAIAAAATVAVSNLWYLAEVKRALHLMPYNRSQVRLIVPLIVCIAAVFAVRMFFRNQPAWLSAGCGLALGYAVFIAVALLAGLDDDDRMIARAVWKRVRGYLPGEAYI